MDEKVVIIGGNHHNTLSVLRSLGRKGILSDLILTTKEKKPFVAKSKYIRKLFICHNDDDIIPLLVNQYKKIPSPSFSEKPVVIACHDLAASLVDINYDLLEPFLILPGSKSQGEITRYMNKKEMAILASSNGLQIPKSWSHDDLPLHIDNIFFPCIVKPLVSKNGTKSEIKICYTKTELQEYASKHEKSEYQIQQFIKKEFEYQLIGCSIQSGKAIVIPGRTHIIHQPIETNTAFLRYEELDGKEPMEQCKKFIQATGYSGLFSLEFLRGEDGEDYFMEINFRNDGNAISVTDAGVNLPYIWYLASRNMEYTNEINLINSIYVMPEVVVISLWSCGRISFRNLVEDFILKDFSMDYDKADPSPTNGEWGYRFQLLLGIMRYVKNLYKKRH